MAWNNRVRDAVLISPSGNRYPFDYEDVSENVELRGSVFEFVDADGTYIQRTGNSGRRYPMRIFISGNDYDLAANNFMAAILENGISRIEHPIYDTRDVVPFGTVTRNDSLKTAANQAVIEVTFFETIGLIYPSSQTDPGAAVLSSVDDFNVSLGDQFDDLLNVDTASLRASFKNNYTALLDGTRGGLQTIANAQDNVRTQFNAIADSINNGIDTLIAQPITLALQTAQLIQSPARISESIRARLDAYSNLAQSITGSVASPGLDSKNANQFYTNDVYASSYVSGSVVSAVNTRFRTKREAIETAEFILNQFDEVAAWRDDNFESLGVIDTGESYQRLQESVALCAGFLVDISFSLKQERVLILDRPRCIIDLSAEIYGQVDEQLDFLINTNNLSGSEILELPAGRRVVYYV